MFLIGGHGYGADYGKKITTAKASVRDPTHFKLPSHVQKLIESGRSRCVPYLPLLPATNVSQTLRRTSNKHHVILSFSCQLFLILAFIN